MLAQRKNEGNIEYRRIDSIQTSHVLREPKDIEGLAWSIKESGLQSPISITKEGILVAGNRRLLACKSLGWEEIPSIVHEYNEPERELAQLSENILRDDGTELEQCSWLARIKVL